MVCAIFAGEMRRPPAIFFGSANMLRKFGIAASSLFPLNSQRKEISLMLLSAYIGVNTIGLGCWNSSSLFAGAFGKTRTIFEWVARERLVGPSLGMPCCWLRITVSQMLPKQSTWWLLLDRSPDNLQVTGFTK